MGKGTNNVGAGKRNVSAWEVYRREGGKRKRSYFYDSDSAEQEASRLRDQLAVTGQAWRILTGPERDEAIAVAVEAKGTGESLRRIWEAHRATPKTLSPKLSIVIAELIPGGQNEGGSAAVLEGFEHNLKVC